jgi:glycosyltransferase involved in cell wall biosynthesis
MNAPANSESDSRQMVFIMEVFIMGGIETLMARLAKALTGDGWQVTILTRTAAPEAVRMLDKSVHLHQLGEQYRRLYSSGGSVKLLRSLGLEKVRAVFSGDGAAGWIATVISSFLPSHPAILCGVYVPTQNVYPPKREFFRSCYGKFLAAQNFDRNVADSCKLFYSERIRELHSRSFGRSLSEARVWLLPIDSSMFKSCRRRPQRGKIVSIGRLVHWKSYNLYMFPIVRRLADRGYPVRWDVYGDGAARGDMEKLIREHSLESHVTLHGTLDYERMGEALQDAWVFVGSGTAIIEAGFCRVPSIMGIGDDKTAKSYGYLYDVPLGCLSESLDSPPDKDVCELIEKLFQLNESEYQREMEKTWQYVQPFDQDRVYKEFIQSLATAAPARLSRFKVAAYNAHAAYRRWRFALAQRSQATASKPQPPA